MRPLYKGPFEIFRAPPAPPAKRGPSFQDIDKPLNEARKLLRIDDKLTIAKAAYIVAEKYESDEDNRDLLRRKLRRRLALNHCVLD